MCKAPKIEVEQLQAARYPFKTRKASLPLVFQSGASNVAILSIFAILRTFESFNPQKTFLLPYLLFFSFLLNIPRNLLASLFELYQSFKIRWRKSRIKTKLSSRTLRTISSSDTLSRLSKVPSMSAFRKISKNIRSSCRKRASLKAISRPECFARLSSIGRLSISDVVTLFQYATDVNQSDFDKDVFVLQQSKLVRSIITAMDVAVKVSRGGISKGPEIIQDRNQGDVDALYFIAAIRVFAEWRAIRLIPKGNKTYATSVKMGSRDMVKNLSKIEDGVHSYLNHHDNLQQHGGERSIPSPTLRHLLKFEKDIDVHTALPCLIEKSAASGVLWTKRQIGYQLAMFRNSLQVPFSFKNGEDAAKAAYKEIYEEYHSFALRIVFSRAFGMSPPLDELWSTMTPPPYDEEYLSKPPELFRSLSDSSDEEDDNEFLVALDEFGKNVAEKWEEMLGHFNCMDDKKKKDHPHNLLQPSDPSFLYSVTETESESLSSIEKDQESGGLNAIDAAKTGAAMFVERLSPLLNEVGSLLEELNMNDPTKA